MSAADDAAARRAAWLAAGAPDYNAPTTNSSGQTTGYVSVAAEPQSARSSSNQSLQLQGNQVVDTATGQSGPYYPAQGTVNWLNQPAQPVQQPIQQSTQPNPTPTTGDVTVSTCKGSMTRNFLQSQLYDAGYDGPWDTASMVAAFNRAACPSLGGTTSGGGSGGGSAGGGGTSGDLTGSGSGQSTQPGLMDQLSSLVSLHPVSALLVAAVAGWIVLGKKR